MNLMLFKGYKCYRTIHNVIFITHALDHAIVVTTDFSKDPETIQKSEYDFYGINCGGNGL